MTDGILLLGSCFAANIGSKLAEDGYEICLNPFGTLFNPASIASSLRRLESAQPFGEEDCVMMGAGAGLWGSFSHYTRFARHTREEFLANANAALEADAAFYRGCGTIIVTFGTAFVFRNEAFARGSANSLDGIVSNCLKLPAREFTRFRLSVDDIVKLWTPLLDGPLKDKRLIFTVSPIRHLADTAHGNQLSKSTLLLAIDALMSGREDRVAYFPSYEIMLDDLRDYRWYADDKVHPSDEAVRVIYKRFLASGLISSSVQ